jgi:hypothetical protein
MTSVTNLTAFRKLLVTCITKRHRILSTIDYRNMNTDQERKEPDAALASYVEALHITVDLDGETSYSADEGDYLDDMVASEPAVDAVAIAAAIEASVEYDNAPDFVKNDRVLAGLRDEPLSVWRETTHGLRLLGEPDDRELVATKLRGYDLVTDLKTLYPGDHMRITQNKYQEDGRRCSYIILKRYDADAGVWWVNGYNSLHPDWKIDIAIPNHHKQVRFYRKREVPHTGNCIRCRRGGIKSPYTLCYDCRNNNWTRSR